MDAGEAPAIALALETDDCILIIDEKKGRKLAHKLHIEIAGTLQVLLPAKTKGVISSLKETIYELEKENFRFTQSLKQEILKRTGEQ